VYWGLGGVATEVTGFGISRVRQQEHKNKKRQDKNGIETPWERQLAADLEGPPASGVQTEPPGLSARKLLLGGSVRW